MPLPDPHAGEPTAEIDPDAYKMYLNALSMIEKWQEHADLLQEMIQKQMGDAYAATINGEKVLTHRPKQQWATQRIRKDLPDLAAHFMKWQTKEVFDLERFKEQHPDIANQYQVRSFNRVG